MDCHIILSQSDVYQRNIIQNTSQRSYSLQNYQKILNFSVFYYLFILQVLFISWKANKCYNSCSDGVWGLRALRFNIPTSQHR